MELEQEQNISILQPHWELSASVEIVSYLGFWHCDPTIEMPK